jgi:hypothetical protein
MHPMQDYFFLKVFHKYYNFICTPICTKNFILVKCGCYSGARPACPREEDEGDAGWAGQRMMPSGGLAVVAQKGGKGEWAGRGGRRGGPRLGRIRSRARIQKKFFSNFNLFLKFDRTLEIYTRRFRRYFDTMIFPKIF